MDLLHRCGRWCAVFALLWGTPALAEDQIFVDWPATDYQVRRLMSPSANERAAEQSGRVYIYDSLAMNDVNTALDHNFERIQYMMFTRIHHAPAAAGGPVEIEDEGCD